MKKIVIAIFIFCMQLYAGFENCNPYAISKFSSIEKEITKKFNDLKGAIAELDKAYKSYLDALATQNELYEKLQILKSENAKSDAEKLFEYQKASNLLGLIIEER
ncbi:MAG: hypothetical protein LBG67_02190 [Campylobacteraceae bacterium]|nr:hypothetical protein [Campylobacteraceae bacterium]